MALHIDFAPMEGITNAAFRRLHAKYFPGVDRYYMPFISPTQNRVFTPREMRDIAPENNAGVCAVPQILSKNAGDFLWAAGELCAMGYGEVNLNAGCPSGTVTAKGKGAGLLADVQALDAFLEGIFEKAPCAISVKTRLGMEDAEEFGAILEVYNKYPISELIVHPRVRKDFYRERVREGEFEKALASSKNPVSFNGGIVTPEDVFRTEEKYPGLKSIMLGQGLVSDPFLAGRVKYGAGSDMKLLKDFHDELFEVYAAQFSSRVNAMKRMKEMWVYLIRLFAGSEKAGKKLFKAKTPEEYISAVEAVFAGCGLLERSTGGW